MNNFDSMIDCVIGWRSRIFGWCWKRYTVAVKASEEFEITGRLRIYIWIVPIYILKCLSITLTIIESPKFLRIISYSLDSPHVYVRYMKLDQYMACCVPLNT